MYLSLLNRLVAERPELPIDTKGRSFDSNFPIGEVAYETDSHSEETLLEEFLVMAANREIYIEESEATEKEREELEEAWNAEDAPVYFRVEMSNGATLEVKRTVKPFIAIFRIENEVGAKTWGLVNR